LGEKEPNICIIQFNTPICRCNNRGRVDMANNKQFQSETLHITSDNETAQQLRQALGSGEFLAWQDALYEGPIDANLNLTQLSRKRAKYFANIGWIEKDEIVKRYQTRNKLLFAYQQFQEIVLWFDQDLNSQLQLVQIIDWFSRHKLDTSILSLVSVDRLPGVSAYLGLKVLSDENLTTLFAKRSEVTLGQMEICRFTWRTIGSSNPNGLLRFHQSNTSTMPHLKNAILRLLKQFPSQVNGLSQSELMITNIIAGQAQDAEEIYLAMQSKEGIPFMNRAMFMCYLQHMCGGENPLIEKHLVSEETAIEEEDGEYEEVLVNQQIIFKVSNIGRQVMHNWVDWLQVNKVSRWLGGVKITEGSIWRYDEHRRKLTKTYV